jgi:hypothetical protein
MGLKSLSLTKKIIKNLINEDLANYTIADLRGLDEVGSYSWSTFRKGEFEQIISVFNELFTSSRVFESLEDEQVFFINLTCNMTEFDVVTILSFSDTKIVVNIEVKTNEGNVEDQCKKRLDEFLPILFPRLPLVTIGFEDSTLIVALFKNNDEEITEVDHIDDLDSILEESTYNGEALNDIRIIDKIDSIQEVYKDIESGNFRYYKDTRDVAEKISSALDENNDIIICNSKAGFGKTVLAFKFYFERNDVHLLMMNQKFYYALGMYKYYHADKCITFGTDALLSLDLTDKVVIIDEAQRVDKHILKSIINKAKTVIWFGDLTQSFRKTDPFLRKEELIEYLESNEFEHKYISLKNAKRYDQSVDRAISFLLGYQDDKSLLSLEDYEINLYHSEKRFIDKLELKRGKLFSTMNHLEEENKITINSNEFEIVDKENWEFSITNESGRNFGHTLHALSFDVDDCFVYIENVKLNDDKKRIISKDIEELDHPDHVRFHNELYVLFTRGKKSLNILVKDLEVYLFLNKKVKTIRKYIEN